MQCPTPVRTGEDGRKGNTMAQKRRGHGEGSIKQRADGLWEARVSLEGGKRKSFYGKSRREAQDKLRAALRGSARP